MLHEWNQKLWIYKGKKKELRGREKLRSGSGTQRMTISYSMQSSTSIRKWQAALWLHHCYCPHTVNLVEFGCVSRTVSLSYSSSTMRSLRTSCWKGKTWGHLSLPWWMWSFCAVENRWGVASCRILKNPTMKLRENFTSVHFRKKKRSFKMNLNLWSHCAYIQRRH